MQANALLLSVAELREQLIAAECVIFDCRFELTRPGAGFEKYLQTHIPGAVYAHLDNDLSNQATPGRGRHPLPDADKFAAFLARSGWQAGKLLVAYDDAGGAIAARLWWLMKYFGHDCAALLDGGIPAWKAAGLPLESGQRQTSGVPVAKFRIRENLVLSTSKIIEGLNRKEVILADARAAARFAGEMEPIDSVAGHIPGSVNYPFHLTLLEDGRFKPVDEIRRGFLTLVGNHDQQNLVHMCGSGVTACHNLFAAELAGFENSGLYVDSWSGWIEDPSRPIATN